MLDQPDPLCNTNLLLLSQVTGQASLPWVGMVHWQRPTALLIQDIRDQIKLMGGEREGGRDGERGGRERDRDVERERGGGSQLESTCDKQIDLTLRLSRVQEII